MPDAWCLAKRKFENIHPEKEGAEVRKSKNQKRVDALAECLLTRLEQAAEQLDAVSVTCKEKVKTADGETNREYQQIMTDAHGLVDRGGLKQLTGVLKDIKDILDIRCEADTREQEAKIARILHDLEQSAAQAVEVTWEGEVENLAE